MCPLLTMHWTSLYSDSLYHSTKTWDLTVEGNPQPQLQPQICKNLIIMKHVRLASYWKAFLCVFSFFAMIITESVTGKDQCNDSTLVHFLRQKISYFRVIDRAASQLTKTAITVTAIFIVALGYDLWHYLLAHAGVTDYIFFSVKQKFGKCFNNYVDFLQYS